MAGPAGSPKGSVCNSATRPEHVDLQVAWPALARSLSAGSGAA